MCDNIIFFSYHLLNFISKRQREAPTSVKVMPYTVIIDCAPNCRIINHISYLFGLFNEKTKLQRIGTVYIYIYIYIKIDTDETKSLRIQFIASSCQILKNILIDVSGRNRLGNFCSFFPQWIVMCGKHSSFINSLPTEVTFTAVVSCGMSILIHVLTVTVVCWN